MDQAADEQQPKAIDQAQLVTLFELKLISEVSFIERTNGTFELHARDNQGNLLTLATKRGLGAARQFKKVEACVSFVKLNCPREALPLAISIYLM
jgi:hypothetical protein